ncbi:MAG: phosphatase PAP2 family protein [Elusimicrobia bacterium]|nr:phosphatase PAP2 family protein [Elusimicrobiota bacterium]
MRYKTLAFTAALALGLCACQNRDKLRVTSHGPYPDAHYITEAQLKTLVDNFPAPPAPGSEEEKADWKLLLEWQNKRTALQCAAALVQEKSNFPEYFGGDANPFVKPEPKEVLDFMTRFGDDVKLAAARLKKHAKRPRPDGPELRPCIQDVGSKYSYPSIHAAVARAYALLLGDLAPARRAEFLAAADDAALNRLITGVHFPSDLEAGKQYAALVYAELLNNESFRRDADSMRSYLEQDSTKQ